MRTRRGFIASVLATASLPALTWADVDVWRPEQGLLWIHLDADHESVLKWLTEKSGLSPLVTEALLEVGTRPRSVVNESGVLAIFRGVNCNPGADPEDMVAMRMFVTEKRIITMRRHRLMAVQDIHESLRSGSGPTTTGEFFVSVVDRLTALGRLSRTSRTGLPRWKTPS